MRIQHIGQDFSKSVKLNLLPGISIPRGYFTWHLQFVTDVSGVITMHHQSVAGSDGKDLDVIVGRDVRSIEFKFNRHNSFPAGAAVNFRYNMRVDHLILLNLAVKLLK